MSLGEEPESRGQAHVESADARLAHVSVERELHTERTVGIAPYELLRHVARKAHDVLLAQFGKQAQIDVSGVLLVEGVEVHVTLHAQVRVGSPQCHARHKHLRRIHHHGSLQAAHLYAALLLHRALHNLQIGIGRAIIY